MNNEFSNNNNSNNGMNNSNNNNEKFNINDRDMNNENIINDNNMSNRDIIHDNHGSQVNGDQVMSDSNNSRNQEVSQSSSVYRYVNKNLEYSKYDDKTYVEEERRDSNEASTGYVDVEEVAGKGKKVKVKKVKADKVKKEKSKFGFGKVVAAALIFGLISGGVFQGVSYISYQAYQKQAKEMAENEVDIVEDSTEVAENVAVPVAAHENGVISDVSNVVENVMPSIVAINVTVSNRVNDFFGRQYEQESRGAGSGFIIAQNDAQLLIATNNHVVDGANTVEIVFGDESTVEASVKGTDSNTDLAVVSVDLSSLSEETLEYIKVASVGDSENLKAGEMAIAIGNALGYGQSVTVGYISALNREVTVEDRTMTLLQTDAAINSGNSGGALINASGEVIGINTMKYISSGVEGMGYAIPISDAIPMIEELMNREIVATSEQGFLGIVRDSAQNVTNVYAQRFNMPMGVYINEVVEGSPAAEAGLKQSDIITVIKNTKIETIDELVTALSYTKAGETITMKVHSIDETGAYAEREVSVTLGKRQ